MKLNQIKALALVVFIAAVLIVGAMLTPFTFADGGRPDPGTVVGVKTWTFHGPTYAISGTGYSASPRTQSGVDVTKVGAWQAADIFLTGDISGTATITLTPQFSPDGANWANAAYDYVADTLVSTTSVVTGTDGLTATTTTSSSSAITNQAYRIVLSADGTGYIRLPITGEYMRMKMETNGAAGNGVTATVKVTLRNN